MSARPKSALGPGKWTICGKRFSRQFNAKHSWITEELLMVWETEEFISDEDDED